MAMVTEATGADVINVLSAKDFKISAGQPLPYGATVVPGGVNFSVFSCDAESCTLVLFRKGEAQPFAEIAFPDDWRVGRVYTMRVADLDYENIEYGYRMTGRYDPQAGYYFNPENILLDPYAKAVTGRGVWKQRSESDTPFRHRGRILRGDYDWEGDHPLHTPIEDLIIYEMHVRSFTQHPSSGVQHPGTYAGIVEKIPYLKDLRVNCVELMPIYDFDEFENSRQVPDSDEMLVNYWGYSTVGFFAPKAGFAAAGKDGGEITELKDLIKALHRNGIEVVLDVVYNHTAEGNENGPTISFRGIDNRTYYMLTADGHYYNFSGTGNTFNCNQPAVIQFILDSLRYWVTEYHVDGFRFDLASILARAEDGTPLNDPPLLKMIAHDPVLAGCKLIAEPWDAGGLYNVGSFPAYGRWAEWNGKYRDNMRKFLKGDDVEGVVKEIVQRIEGSPDLYPGRGPIATVNFITAHDGFTLADMVSYSEKHNEANLENNQDGFNDNNSWNWGHEGPTEDEGINDIRRRQMKNAMAILLTSQGVPMFLMGDEVARTQQGNNNTYCQDNELNWLDWSTLETNGEMLRFVKNMIAFRHWHPALRGGYFLQHKDYNKAGMPDITWYSLEALTGENSDDERLTMAYRLAGAYAKGGLAKDDDIYVAINMHWEDQYFKLPKTPKGKKWYVFANTGMPAPEDIHEPGTEPQLDDQQNLMLTSRSVVLLLAK
jgi:isoamylase